MDREATLKWLIQSGCGESLDNLAQTMLDHAVSPLDLPLENDGPVHDALTALSNRLTTVLQATPAAERRRLSSRLNWWSRELDLTLGLITDATHLRYFEMPESLYLPPSPKSRVFTALPDLMHRLDGDGLLDVTGLDAQPQAVFAGGYALHYHQFLRRHFTSGINDPLLTAILKSSRTTKATARIAIDERRLMGRRFQRDVFEKDYWYGPPYAGPRLDDPHYVGRTVYRRVAGSRRWGPYDALVVSWSVDGEGFKVCQMEELVRSEEMRELVQAPYVMLRYLHARRNPTTGVFVHCDGAVRAYLPDAYRLRFQEDAPHAGQPARYRKLFRVDGIISTDTWSQVAAWWFRHNELVLEYLSGTTTSLDQTVLK